MGQEENSYSKIYKAIEEYCDREHNFDFDSKNPVIRLHEPTFGAEEIMAALVPMLETRVTMGRRVAVFESEYGNKFGHNHCIMNNSGSSANLLALSAMTSHLLSDPLREGDEVIVPALSWSTTIWPIVQNGLIPVFVDCDPLTWNLDIDEVRAAIGPKTKAIMLVHVYGNPCDMNAILSLAHEYKLKIIEDSCESMGALYNGKSVGTFGAIGTFSFYFSHHITTLEGGMCVTDDYELSEIMRIMRAHGWSREALDKRLYEKMSPHIDPRFIFVEKGYNLRPTEVQASMGSVQLTKLDNIVNARIKNAKFLQNRLNKYSKILQMQVETDESISSWFGVGFVFKEPRTNAVQSIVKHLNKAHIETRPIIAGNMTKHPAMAHINHRINGELKCSSNIMDNGFAIGCHQALDEAALDYMVKMFDGYFGT